MNCTYQHLAGEGLSTPLSVGCADISPRWGESSPPVLKQAYLVTQRGFEHRKENAKALIYQGFSFLVSILVSIFEKCGHFVLGLQAVLSGQMGVYFAHRLSIRPATDLHCLEL